MATRETCKEHVPDLMAFRFTVCRKGHTAANQRTCIVCGAKYCMECAGQSMTRARELKAALPSTKEREAENG